MGNNTANTADRILSWCHRHDWGRDARHVDGQIVGLVESYRDGDVTVTQAVALPADIAIIRAWAGY